MKPLTLKALFGRLNWYVFGLTRNMTSSEIHEQLMECYSIWKETDSLYSEMARKSGLSDTAYWVLYSIWLFGSKCTQKDICEQWSFSKQTVNTALRNLERKGFISLVQVESDKRSKYVVLTEEGKRFASKYIKIILQIEEITLHKMSDAERDAMIRSSRRYLELFREEINNFYLA